MKRVPVLCRVPITNESLMMSACKGSDGCLLEKYPFLMDLLLERILGIVRSLSFKYVVNSSQEFEDLVQDCLVRIWSSRKTFDPKKGRLSTWVWRVCCSVLNSDFGKSKRYKDKFRFWSQTSSQDSGDPLDSSEIFCSNNADVQDIVAFRCAVSDLYVRHGANSSRKEMLDAIFCVEEDGLFVASIDRAAFRLVFPGVLFTDKLPQDQKLLFKKKHGELMRFVRTFVRPVFLKHIKEGI